MKISTLTFINVSKMPLFSLKSWACCKNVIFVHGKIGPPLSKPIIYYALGQWIDITILIRPKYPNWKIFSKSLRLVSVVLYERLKYRLFSTVFLFVRLSQIYVNIFSVRVNKKISWLALIKGSIGKRWTLREKYSRSLVTN